MKAKQEALSSFQQAPPLFSPLQIEISSIILQQLALEQLSSYVTMGHKARPQAPHEVAKPVAMHSRTPLNIEERGLSLKGDSNAKSGLIPTVK